MNIKGQERRVHLLDRKCPLNSKITRRVYELPRETALQYCTVLD